MRHEWELREEKRGGRVRVLCEDETSFMCCSNTVRLKHKLQKVRVNSLTRVH